MYKVDIKALRIISQRLVDELIWIKEERRKMSVDAYACLVVGLPRERLLEKMSAEFLDNIEDEGEGLVPFQFDDNDEFYRFFGIRVTEEVCSSDEESIVIKDKNSLNANIDKAMDEFKEATGMDGDLMLVGWSTW